MSFHSLKWSDYPPAELLGGAVSVGNFDGVHVGHAAMMEATKRHARLVGGPTIAVTFDPPPGAILRPGKSILPLTTISERARLLGKIGADHVVVLQTDASLLALSAEAFFEDVLVRQLGAKAIVEGFNFHFGRARGGNTQVLRNLCDAAGLAFEEFPPFAQDGETVSSSRVRSRIEAGDLVSATKLLGRNFSIEGRVIEGAKRGRTIGFPTANLGAVATVLPANGVYAVWATVDGVPHAAAANIGPNPTFGEHAQKIEVHLLDFHGDLYERTLQVEFVARIRDTVPFANIEALIEQLRRDIREAKTRLV